MSYDEFRFKSEVIRTAQKYYNVNELTLYSGTEGLGREDYLKQLGTGYIEPRSGIAQVTVSGITTSTAWKVYKKSNEETGDMYIGRLDDTAKLYEEFGLGSKSDATFNLMPGKKINVQKLKNWTVLINDCWMLGAIHKFRTFNMVSKISSTEDIWNVRGYFIVTGRELLGLSKFGYKPQVTGNGMSYICVDRRKAASATLRDYAELANKAATSPVEKAKIALFAQGKH